MPAVDNRTTEIRGIKAITILVPQPQYETEQGRDRDKVSDAATINRIKNERKVCVRKLPGPHQVAPL